MKIPNISDLQGKLDDALAANGLGKYIEYAKYLPKDAPVPADATHVLSLRSTKVDSTDQAPKVEVALKARSATIEMLANLGLDLL